MHRRIRNCATIEAKSMRHGRRHKRSGWPVASSIVRSNHIDHHPADRVLRLLYLARRLGTASTGLHSQNWTLAVRHIASAEY